MKNQKSAEASDRISGCGDRGSKLVIGKEKLTSHSSEPNAASDTETINNPSKMAKKTTKSSFKELIEHVKAECRTGAKESWGWVARWQCGLLEMFPQIWATQHHPRSLAQQQLQQSIIKAVEPDDELDGDESHMNIKISQPHIVSGSLKRKADEGEVVPDSEPENLTSDTEDAMEINMTSASIIQMPQPPQKKVKIEQAGAFVKTLPTSQTGKDSELSGPTYKTSREVIKCHSDYSNMDLPVPANVVWSHTFIDTATLWASIQLNVWVILEEDLVVALQTIFNAMYPQVDYTITAQGSVYAIICIGSFCLSELTKSYELPDDTDVLEVEKTLHDGYKFLQEDPDNPSPSHAYRSGFMLELLASVHLSNISSAVNIPQWKTKELMAGKDMEGIVSLCAAAVFFSAFDLAYNAY
ncbi:hypothetical protein PAXRUDRAFT_27519 [Paxillus rubicundulus Ve08.2h10]|uniref:Uncharacterized protein n=1 Tax=Paxillus rubicundulus Ve08.2h10 TaxID=930991 RepID=A0A0D0CKX6_9AGAM|nr:hypothetical protein PAXRUDRAFT_27519 [Paxillus rubicundulus Ve08.2h10]